MRMCASCGGLKVSANSTTSYAGPLCLCEWQKVGPYIKAVDLNTVADLHARVHELEAEAKCDKKDARIKRLREALAEICRVKYGLETHDYDDMEYVADHWSKQAIRYECDARKALAEDDKENG